MQDRFLEGKVAVISGGGRGLGKAMGLALGRAGAALALVARNKDQLDAAVSEAKELGVDAARFVADVSDEEQVLAMEREVVARFGRVDILINNAGTTILKPLVDFSMDEWRKVIDTNLTSAFLMCRSFIPHMRGRGWGRIINMLSIKAHISTPTRGPYTASKTGLLGLTRSLAQELAADGITVVGISPGPFETDISAGIRNDPVRNKEFMDATPLRRWGKPEEIGQLALFLCSESTGYITGTDILIDGGWCAR